MKGLMRAMKKRIRKLITGIMTASILSQFLSGTVSMAAGIDGDSGSSDSAVVLEESVTGDEGEATDAESVDDAGVAGDNANTYNDEDSSASDRATGASDNDEDSANDDTNVSLSQSDEEDLDVNAVSAKFSDDVTSGVEGSEDDLSSDGSVSSNDNFMTVSFGDAGVIDVLDSEDESDNAKEESENNDDEISERGVLESELSGEPYIFDYDSFRVEWKVVSHWEGACNVSVSLTNKSEETIHNWNLSFLSEDEIINPYNARITSEGSNGNKWTFKNLEYNQDIRSGESIQFGFQVKYGERMDIPFSYSIDSSEKKVSDADYEISDQIISSWDGGAVGELRIVNNKDTAIEDWTVTVRTDAVFLTVWGGNIKKVSEDTYEFSCPDYCQNIAPGQTAVIGYQINGDNTELKVLELREITKDGTVSDNSISENSISENSISENSVSDNTVSNNDLVIPDDIYDNTSYYPPGDGWKDIGKAYYKELVSEDQIEWSPEGFQYAKNQLLIYSAEGYSFEDIEDFALSCQMVIVGYVETNNYYQLESIVDLEWEELEIIKDEMEDASEVDSVSYNYVMDVSEEFDISDTQWADDDWDSRHPSGDNWNMEAIDWEGALEKTGIKVNNSGTSKDYDLSKVNPVKIGVIDSGFDISHPDLKNNIGGTYNNYKYDDIRSTSDNHGTHVTGIIGAEFNNNEGISGVCINPELYLCSREGGTGVNCDPDFLKKDNVFKLAYFLTILIENDVKVINYSNAFDEACIVNSLDSSDKSYNEFIRKAAFGNINSDGGVSNFANEIEKNLKYELGKGYDFLIVAAAGNSNNDTYVPYTDNNYVDKIAKRKQYDDAKGKLDSSGKDQSTGYVYDFSKSFGGKYSNAVNKVDVLAEYCNGFAAIKDEAIKDHILIVGAVSEPNGDKYYNTKYTNVGGRVDVVAPGDDILSCSVNHCDRDDESERYIKYNGTSMASPMVAGMAGFMFSIDPSLTSIEVKQKIIESAKYYSYAYNDNNVVNNYPVVNLGNIYADESAPKGKENNHYDFIVDITMSQAEVNEQLNTIREIINYIDIIEPNDGLDSNGNQKYIIWYCDRDYVNSTYADYMAGKIAQSLTSKSFDRYSNCIYRATQTGSAKYDADIVEGIKLGIAFSQSTGGTCYLFNNGKNSITPSDRYFLISFLNPDFAIHSYNVRNVSIQNEGSDISSLVKGFGGIVYDDSLGQDVMIDKILSDLGKKSKYDKLTGENDILIFFFDFTMSEQDIEKQIDIAKTIIDEAEEGDSIVINYYTSDIAYWDDYTNHRYSFESKEEAKEALSNYKNASGFVNEQGTYKGNFPFMIEIPSQGTNEKDKDNYKSYIFYAGDKYDDMIYDHLDTQAYMGFHSINYSIKDIQNKKVIINTIAISSNSSKYMDDLIPITGGGSYSDNNGISGLKTKLVNDLRIQKSFQKEQKSKSGN